MVCEERISVSDLFDLCAGETDRTIISAQGFARNQIDLVDGGQILIDTFHDSGAVCCFLRLAPGTVRIVRFVVSGSYQLNSCPSGGWLLKPSEPEGPSYWIPRPPMARALDSDLHLLRQEVADVSSLDAAPRHLAIAFRIPRDLALDCVVWRLASAEPDLVSALERLVPLETQPCFMWSSHTAYTCPGDVYLHLVHGHVYENHEVWPKYWRVCSELDAYALYVTLSGLLLSTGKELYGLLRTQLVFSVISRQASDGGWYHGEWTDGMESHYRLHAGGMHMLAAYLEETGDPTVAVALDRAADFAATKTDRLSAGAWYLHDSLEENAASLAKYPFRYLPSRALGKSKSNLLVLNTHLDTNIAMARHRRVTGDSRHDELIASARATTRAVLALRPANWLYRPLFWAIGLTFLPTQRAMALPFPLRAIKRLAWKYVIPLLPHIKAVFPRLVMPGGYIERELTMFAFSVRYQPVNLMDLIRTRRLFDESELDPIIEAGFAFTQGSGLRDRWQEFKGKEDDSLGFWAESLYHLALAEPDLRYRAWLAETMIDLHDNRLGMPPSLLGANAEAVAPRMQCPCPSPTDARLRVANLSRGDTIELLVVNPTKERIALEWESSPAGEVTWQEPEATTSQGSAYAPTVQPRAWIRGLGRHVMPPRP